MTNYILKRLLLILPTGIGVITVFFFISEFVPGGPLDQVEQRIMNQANKADPSSMATVGGGGGKGQVKINPRERMLIKRELGLNYGLFERYMRSLLWCSANSVISSVEISPEQSRKVVFRDEERLIYRGQDNDYHLYRPEVTLSKGKDKGKSTTVSFDKGQKAKPKCYVSVLDPTVSFDPATGKQIDGPDKMTSIPVVAKSQTFLVISSLEIGPGESKEVTFRGEKRWVYRGQNDDYHLYLPEVTLSKGEHKGESTTLSFDKGQKPKPNCYVSLLDSTVRFDPVTGKQIDGPGQMTSIPVVGKSQTFTETIFLANGDKEKTKETRTEIYVDESTRQVMGNWKNWHGMFLMKFPLSVSKNKKCWELIRDRLHISMRLGITAFLVTYSICITLGIAKACRNDSKFDSLTSMVILIGYGIPGFVLAVFLIKGFGPGSDAMVHWIPLRGIHSPDDIYNKMNGWQKFVDSAHHMVAPVLCLTIGSFAQLTLLTKNSVLDQFNQLYATAARARGLSHRSVLIRHVLRNAMIPLVTGFPAAFVFMFFAGSVLIEKIFSIDGIGLLSYTALIERDYPLIISNMFIFTFMGLMCKLLSDLMYVVVDPRISFEGSKA